MNFDKFFQLAKQRGIATSQLRYVRSSSLSMEIFRHEIENYEVSEEQSITAAGIYNGKFGSCRTEKVDKSAFEFLTDKIILSASTSEKTDSPDIFEGSKKYKKAIVYNPAISAIPAEEKLAIIKRMEEKAYAMDPRVADVEVSYSETEGESAFCNSFGLRLKQKRNSVYIGVFVVMREGEVTKNNYEYFLDNKMEGFDEDEVVRKAVEGAAKKFGAKSIASGVYPTVIDRSVMAALINYFLSSAIADEVQRGTSMLEGKLGQKVASSKLTIEERPLERNLHFSSFDGEGVATYNKTVLKNGVLMTYFYNRETAKKDGVESTANGTWGGGKISTGYGNIFVKPGRKSFDELIAPIQNGVYITEVAGLGTGMNETSGNFSCQAEGFRIVDGKLGEPLTLITLSGNLLKMLADLREFSSETRMSYGGINVAHASIRKMNIGGE